MKILLIGTGAVGSVICSELAKERRVSKIICGTNDLKRARHFINTKNRKVSVIKLDAADIDLREITKRFRGATYIAYPTGLSASVFAKVLPKIKKYGVFPPEALDSDLRKEIFIGLENQNVVVQEQFSKY